MYIQIDRDDIWNVYTKPMHQKVFFEVAETIHHQECIKLKTEKKPYAQPISTFSSTKASVNTLFTPMSQRVYPFQILFSD